MWWNREENKPFSFGWILQPMYEIKYLIYIRKTHAKVKPGCRDQNVRLLCLNVIQRFVQWMTIGCDACEHVSLKPRLPACCLDSMLTWQPWTEGIFFYLKTLFFQDLTYETMSYNFFVINQQTPFYCFCCKFYIFHYFIDFAIMVHSFGMKRLKEPTLQVQVPPNKQS